MPAQPTALSEAMPPYHHASTATRELPLKQRMWWSFLLVRQPGTYSCLHACSLINSPSVPATGVDGSQEAEGKDKTSLTLPGTQLSMLNQIAAAVASTKKPVILGVTGGSAVDLTSMKASASIQSIVWFGYPGQAGGTAIAKALYGTENRFGKLPMTFYDEQFCAQVNLTDYRMRPDPATGFPVRETVPAFMWMSLTALATCSC